MASALPPHTQTAAGSGHVERASADVLTETWDPRSTSIVGKQTWGKSCGSAHTTLTEGAEMEALRPLQDRIIVKRDAAETMIGSLIIPEHAAEKPTRGEVLAVGPGRRLKDGSIHPLAVEVGDVVLFGKYTGTEVEQDGAKLVVMREEDVMAVITE